MKIPQITIEDVQEVLPKNDAEARQMSEKFYEEHPQLKSLKDFAISGLGSEILAQLFSTGFMLAYVTIEECLKQESKEKELQELLTIFELEDKRRKE